MGWGQKKKDHYIIKEIRTDDNASKSHFYNYKHAKSNSHLSPGRCHLFDWAVRPARGCTALPKWKGSCVVGSKDADPGDHHDIFKRAGNPVKTVGAGTETASAQGQPPQWREPGTWGE